MQNNTTRITRTYHEMSRFSYDNPNHEACWPFDLDDPHDDIVAHFTSCNPSVQQWLKEVAYLEVDSDSVTWNPEITPKLMRALATVIAAEHEALSDLYTVWEAFDLRGDDAVDYNGSYLHACADLLEAVS